ncbi:MAG: hypothetical protein A2W93_01655 [Bacteroidetes bacterium GWF2_43_63]|nr:MAG: hypothetical protein A2W93_01655 [Bacteroidetes bacterium GWF2_43_63]HBG71311.1 hypothetical protein [Bacteroidales bacterium]
MVLFVFAFVKANSAIYYVNDASVTGDVFCTAVGNNANNGTSASTPKLTLINLLSAYSTVLTTGDTIKIDAGTYNNEENIDFSKAGVTFLGAGPSLTIFDDNGAGTATNFFMYIHANNVTVKNMTIREYENNGSQTPGHSGQAITIQNATGVLLENIISSYNGQSGGNPSISVLSNSGVTIRGGGGLCNIWQTQYTGGVEAYGTNINLTIENYVFAYNFKDGAYDGGGLLISNGDATTIVSVSNCRFYGNDASDGGAISQRCGVLTVTDCIIDNNYAGQVSTSVYGGAVRITGGNAIYTNTRFLNNTKSGTTTLRGGAIGLYSSDNAIDLTLNNCYFSGNSGDEGDDIYADKYMSGAKTINVHAVNTTFSSTSDAIYNKDAEHIHLKDCGDPAVAGSNSPAVFKENTTAPSSTPNPTTPTLTGDCSTGITLPVELTGFYGMCSEDKTELYWQTASETNNHYFIIQKSVNGLDFYPVGTIDGSGNSNQLINYQFSDNEPAAEGAYYRLVQVDFDGATATLDPIFVSNKCNNAGVEITSSYYNPETHLLQIEIVTAKSGISRLTLTDYLGRILLAEVMNLEEGINNFSIAIPEINPSVCLLILQHNNVNKTRKVPVF